MRLASGIAPIKKYRQAGVKVGLGVDGSASNDGSHMLNEARMAMLLARVSGDPAGLTAREALEIATLGGAAVLGRDDVGALAKGMCGDFIAFKTDTLEFAGGAVHDPVAALVFCAPAKPDMVMVNGKLIVSGGELQTVELPPVIEKHNKIAKKMVSG
jgi:cytosine/adenosine deaminase-related metal-dependent hydrolase